MCISYEGTDDDVRGRDYFGSEKRATCHAVRQVPPGDCTVTCYAAIRHSHWQG